jgi:hypothetical protein
LKSDLTWSRNSTTTDEFAISVGDRVTLRASDTWNYDVRADVQNVTGTDITAIVVDIFDRDAAAQIRGGEILELIGKVLTFQSDQVFAVLKRG